MILLRQRPRVCLESRISPPALVHEIGPVVKELQGSIHLAVFSEELAVGTADACSKYVARDLADLVPSQGVHKGPMLLREQIRVVGVNLHMRFADSARVIARSAELAHESGGAWRELMQVGERIFNLKRMISVRRGISRKDDMLPPRILTQRLAEGGTRGNLPQLGKMLNEYYAFREWSEEGIPTKKKLTQLGLEECLGEAVV